MEPIYSLGYFVDDLTVDRFGYLKPSAMFFLAQEAAGRHCTQLQLDHEALAGRRMFWAIIRQRLQITRLPRRGETLRVETWPMPTTRVAYPRSVVAFDQEGRECFRSVSLWVLMDTDSRAMILPGKSGITVPGTLRGTELAAPGALHPGQPRDRRSRTVCYTDLDRNGHMNNTRYLEWIWDLLPSSFHRDRKTAEITACYFSESREAEELILGWSPLSGDILQVDIHREKDGKGERVFSAQIRFHAND